MTAVIPHILVVAIAVAPLGCGTAPVAHHARAENPLRPREIQPLSSERAGALAQPLDRRHHTHVTVHAALDLGERQILLYGWPSLTAWVAFERLEPWEREDAEWSADGELALWLAGVEARDLLGEAQRHFDALAESCHLEGDGDGCRQSDLWELVASTLPETECDIDRVGLALFGDGGAASSGGLLQVVELEGQRCQAAASRLSAIELDRDRDVELLLEIAWVDPEAERVDLLVLDDDLRTLATRRLFTAPTPPHRSSDTVRDGRFWFDDLTGDGAPELVVESFEIPARCALFDCARFLGIGSDDDCLQGAREGCERRGVDRQVLLRDPSRGLWL